ncbi:MAG TPA: MBL fold metallo-hydrolase [Nitrososphaeraceae archaeon]|jgi:L-ascorbate metabolism protein UlaG (beta-lactamase superfamily)|nr:MBL fold metallo-hydrolase [Nitrososphaeraceae archaeon]
MFEYNNIGITWTGHAGFKITYKGKNIYIDPYKLSKKHENISDADVVLVSHNHFDHLSIEDLKNIVNETTVIVSAQECLSQLKSLNVKESIGIDPRNSVKVNELKIETVPAYNVDKEFHPKNDKKIGFIVEFGNDRLYHTGDSDIIPEMKDTSSTIALIPVSGTYVMTAEEASKAINELINPKITIPMHYGTIVGNKEDAIRFSELVTVCKTEILESE